MVALRLVQTFILSFCIYFYISILQLDLICSLGEYFPKAYDDVVSVWEDESIAYSTLENDYFAGGNASIVDFSKVWLKPGSLSLWDCGVRKL